MQIREKSYECPIILFRFEDRMVRQIHSHYTHIRIDRFPKNTVLDSEDLKACI